MESKKVDQKFWLRIDKGEKFPQKLIEFAIKNGLKTAQVKGIGAIKNPLLSYYIPKKNSYKEKQLSGDFEILSLLGNITFLEETPFPHFHVSLSDANFKAFGGHLKECEVTGTLELFVEPTDVVIERQHDTDTNLQIWKLAE